MQIETQTRIYCELMEDAKQRLGLVRQLAEGSISTTRIEYDTELACLNLRRVLELIAFSSLAANKTAYKEHYPHFHTHWKAGNILKMLEEINPNYYPIPVEFKNNHYISAVEIDFLSKDQFLFLYDKCCDVIHTWNPYRKDARLVNFEKPLAIWAELIWNLLSVHYISIAGSNNKLIVQMTHSSDGKVHVFSAEPIN